MYHEGHLRVPLDFAEPFQMPPWPRFFWLALVPQMVFWVAFTIVLGSLTGSLAAIYLASRSQRPPAR